MKVVQVGSLSKFNPKISTTTLSELRSSNVSSLRKSSAILSWRGCCDICGACSLPIRDPGTHPRGRRGQKHEVCGVMSTRAVQLLSHERMLNFKRLELKQLAKIARIPWITCRGKSSSSDVPQILLTQQKRAEWTPPLPTCCSRFHRRSVPTYVLRPGSEYTRGPTSLHVSKLVYKSR